MAARNNSGASIKYGKIEVFSTEGDLDSVVKKFTEIMNEFGYPEREEAFDFDDEVDNDLEKTASESEEEEEPKDEAPKAPWLKK